MIEGRTFHEQNNPSESDGAMYGAMFGMDGITEGCEISTVGNNVIIGLGHFIVGGRISSVTAPETIEVQSTVATGYAQLIAQIDLNATATIDEFEQLKLVFRYSATADFPDLVQEAINIDGKIYEAEIAVFNVSNYAPTSIVRQWGVIRSEYAGKANMSTVSTHTLQSANWVNGVYTLTVAGMTAERYGEVNPADDATDEQILAMQGANAVIRSGAGKITFTALGKAPTINVPITVILRGDVQ